MKGFVFWQTVCTRERKDTVVLSEVGCARLKLSYTSVSSQDVGCGLCLVSLIRA